MDRAQIIAKLVEKTNLTSEKAAKLIDERIAGLEKESTRKNIEANLKKIRDILLLYDGKTEETEEVEM